MREYAICRAVSPSPTVGMDFLVYDRFIPSVSQLDRRYLVLLVRSIISR